MNEEVTLGDLIPDSVQPTGRKRFARDLYDMDYRLKGDASDPFPDAFRYAYEHLPALSAALVMAHGKYSAEVDGNKLRLHDVSFEEVEEAILAAARDAIASANQLVKDVKAEQEKAAKQRAEEAQSEMERRKAFIERNKTTDS